MMADMWGVLWCGQSNWEVPYLLVGANKVQKL